MWFSLRNFFISSSDREGNTSSELKSLRKGACRMAMGPDQARGTDEGNGEAVGSATGPQLVRWGTGAFGET